MWRLDALKVFISQRLSAAVDDILGHVDRTIQELEQDTEFRTGVPPDVQQLLLKKDELQQPFKSFSPDLEDQEIWQDQEPPYIKEEKEELQDLEGANVTNFLISPGPVKSEDDEEEPQCSKLHHSHTENRGSVEGLEPEPSPGLCLQPDTDYRTSVHEHSRVAIGTFGCNDLKKSFSCSECGKIFAYKAQLESHMRAHTGERPFRCSVCKKSFSWSGRLQKHMKIHTGEKPFSCSVCGKCFIESGNLKVHMRIHTGEKPFSCSVCGKRYAQRGNLKQHMVIHRGEAVLSCSVCDKTFTWLYQINNHECVQSSQHHHSHAEDNRDSVGGPEPAKNSEPLALLQSDTDNKTSHRSQHGVVPVSGVGCNNCKRSFSCSECGKRFAYKGQLKAHMRSHTGERPFRCLLCRKSFSWKRCLQKHMRIHTGEKPYSCTVCGKTFNESGNLKVHMRIHTGEKPFSCSVCGKKYTQKGTLTKHLEVHKEEK